MTVAQVYIISCLETHEINPWSHEDWQPVIGFTKHADALKYVNDNNKNKLKSYRIEECKILDETI